MREGTIGAWARPGVWIGALAWAASACGSVPEAVTAESPSTSGSWTAGLPASTHVDPATDPTLASIFGSVDGLTEDQKHGIAERFVALRDQQHALLARAPSMPPGGVGKAGKAGAMPGGRPMPSGPAPVRAGGGGRYPMGVYAQSDQLNQAFLAEGRSLMRPEQLSSWDDCAALIVLHPPELGTPGGPVQGGPALGATPPALTLTTLAGEPISLESLRGAPVVVQFGSYTCPSFRKEDPKLDVVRAQFGDRVQWVVVYGAEAHPSDGRVSQENVAAGITYPTQRTAADRRAMAEVAVGALGLTDTIALDGMDDAVTSAWAGHPNRVYVLDAEGEVAAKFQRALASDVNGALVALLPE